MVTTTSFVKTRERKRKGERKEEKEEKLQRHITTTTTVSCGAFVLECGCVRACVKNKNKIKKLSMISCLHASSRFSSFCRLCFLFVSHSILYVDSIGGGLTCQHHDQDPPASYSEDRSPRQWLPRFPSFDQRSSACLPQPYPALACTGR